MIILHSAGAKLSFENFYNCVIVDDLENGNREQEERKKERKRRGKKERQRRGTKRRKEEGKREEKKK
jgi:hypothetical protein